MDCEHVNYLGVAGSSSITNNYGVRVNTPSLYGGSTITNNYGIYLANQGGIGSSNSYAIYSAGGQSYFAGALGIGTTNSTYKLNIDSETGTTGFCRVTIPKDLLNTEGNWIVLVDSSIVIPTVNEDSNSSYIYFTYSHSTKTVELIGTDAIPEFPSWMILPLIMIVTLFAVVFRKKLSLFRKVLKKG